MNLTLEQCAVWRSMDDFTRGKEPVAVGSDAACWAVYNLLNPPWTVSPNGNRRRSGPFPVKDVLYTFTSRPALAEDTHRLTSHFYSDRDEWERAEALSEAAAIRARKEGYYA